jgi:uncharacterized membrane protein
MKRRGIETLNQFPCDLSPLQGEKIGIVVLVLSFGLLAVSLYGMLFWTPVTSPAMHTMGEMYLMMLWPTLLTGSVLTLFVGGLLYYMLRAPKPSPGLQNLTSQREGPMGLVEKFLKPDELRVVQALRKAGGSLLQKEVGRSTGLSRLKTHRVVLRLAERGLVSVERVGRTNRVSLPAWLMEGSGEPQQST